jgi:hypothetical protein
MHSSDVNFASHFQINAQDPRSIKDSKENTTEKGFRKVVIFITKWKAKGMAAQVGLPPSPKERSIAAGERRR